MTKFYLQRNEDESGVSGTGRVAQGIIFDNGMCAMCWLTPTSSVAIYQSIEDVEKIHGHVGKTQVVIDGMPEKEKYTPSFLNWIRDSNLTFYFYNEQDEDSEVFIGFGTDAEPGYLHDGWSYLEQYGLDTELLEDGISLLLSEKGISYETGSSSYAVIHSYIDELKNRLIALGLKKGTAAWL